MKPNTEATGTKPRIALWLATGLGLGYLPRVPGTWGSLGGVALAWGIWQYSVLRPGLTMMKDLFPPELIFFEVSCLVIVPVAAVGVWVAGRAAKHLGSRDPRVVVIDEVSGQHLTYLIGLGWVGVLNWKYLLLGFILFRAFDIWKPFPARQAESLPGGWGIMADDWAAGFYAAMGLWLARALGL